MTAPRRALPLLTDLPPAPASPHSGTPARHPGSVRRTGHWNMTWPDGLAGGMQIDAAARDLVTRADGGSDSPDEARPDEARPDEAQLHVRVDGTRVLRSLESTPERAELQQLLGGGGGSGYRHRLQGLIPDEMAAGTLTYFLLDDMPGVTLVGPFAWRLWPEAQEMYAARRHRGPGYDMTGICSGFRPDGFPVKRIMGGEDPQHNLVPAFELAEPGDPLAWHEIAGPPGDAPMLRRRRRVDVVDGPQIRVDSLFRDSMWSPDGVETVVHEYGVHAVVDRATMRLTSITADPRVLPFPTCPAAAANVDLLTGEPMATLRHRVLELVIGTDGCTHLNDALRALAEVPIVVERLDRAQNLG
ncbi:DUF2889 domain-containing protein [Pseudonocardia kunmingensis]|uniref:DUF2889 family protein n=1 Tax=Pseudonocardia kunmingensis TaxID=630975 RepID=A0A543DPH5_9PSEU|nr:DUF2889 domain-containing protein [Pseudonocardia kunmingensis]TQM11193.1 DUF2889 family protein [Pseudonocardia kunmingensis]